MREVLLGANLLPCLTFDHNNREQDVSFLDYSNTLVWQLLFSNIRTAAVEQLVVGRLVQLRKVEGRDSCIILINDFYLSCDLASVTTVALEFVLDLISRLKSMFSTLYQRPLLNRASVTLLQCWPFVYFMLL